MDVPKLGKLPKKNQFRDAVHVAIAPVVASQDLSPGDHVGLRWDNGRACYASAGDDYAIGIVDPFLTKRVKEGETFWLCLYPSTTTSLRHVWTHPAFQAKLPEAPS